jgi:hypothetical protein
MRDAEHTIAFCGQKTDHGLPMPRFDAPQDRRELRRSTHAVEPRIALRTAGPDDKAFLSAPYHAT